MPLEAGTTYRPGTRFGPQGDVVTIPANLEKSFDQIAKAISHVAAAGVMPVVLGGDHSIGYPTILDALATMVASGKLGRRVATRDREAWGPYAP
ncbi:arginase family protein [Nonomuraea sp. NPDC048916]|uniref:arginase family protein n=1 Tax=Nonomuraea sp. NPDC048916 TaxID=3154232 RepID=UPI003407CA9E